MRSSETVSIQLKAIWEPFLKSKLAYFWHEFIFRNYYLPFVFWDKKFAKLSQLFSGNLPFVFSLRRMLFRLELCSFDFAIIETFCYHRALQDFQLLMQVFSPEHHDRSLAVMQTICFLVTVSSDIVRVFVVVKQLIYVQYFQTGRKFFNLFWVCFVKLI